jgi:hypothetical protein
MGTATMGRLLRTSWPVSESWPRPLSSGLNGAGNHTAGIIGVRSEAAINKYIYVSNRQVRVRSILINMRMVLDHCCLEWCLQFASEDHGNTSRYRVDDMSNVHALAGLMVVASVPKI